VYRALLVLLSGISISIFAATMSIVGMSKLFPAAGWVIVAAMIALESAKLISAEWVHKNWKNSNVSRAHKTYMTSAIVALMLITSMGIFGYLSAGHLEASAPLAPVELQIAQKEERLKQLQNDLARYSTQQTQLNASVDAFLKKDDAKAGLKARQGMSGERKGVQKQIDSTNSEINQINESLVPLKVQVTHVEAKLGPIKYVAELFGWKDPEVAVRMVIMLLMFAFDPLAVVMLISGTITLGEWGNNRKLTDEKTETETETETSPKLPDSLSGTHIDLNEIVPELTERQKRIPSEYADIIPHSEEINPKHDDVFVDATPITEDMFSRWKGLTEGVTVDDDYRVPDDFVLPGSSFEELSKEYPEMASSIGLSLSEHIIDEPDNLLKELHDITEANRLKAEEVTPEQKEAESELEPLPPISDKEILIALLEENPNLLKEVIEVVEEARRDNETREQSQEPEYKSWLDAPK
jgi:hypothetical protein